MKTIFKTVAMVFFLAVNLLKAQVTQGKIVYERKTNLYKKFKGNISDWIKEEDRIKTDMFELYFNDSLSAFKPQDSDLKEDMSWATSKNQVYQNFNAGRKFSVKSIWSEKFYMEDSLSKRKWKITDSRRTIAGFNCRKAIWQCDDTTRIYAWYCNEIMVSTGPESYNGLPGLILGLATEDGGVIYFAKQVELTKQDVSLLRPEKVKGKIYTATEMKARFEKDFAKEKWLAEFLRNNFKMW